MKKIIWCALSFAIVLGCLCFPCKQTAILNCNADDYTAKSVVLMDYNSGKVLYEKEKRKHLPIASMVKLMTVLLTLENIENGNLAMDQKVVVSQKASGMGGSQVFLDANVEYTIEDLLKSAIVASANDASVALAETIAGSESEFVKLMNQRASELGMNDTNYENATGLPMPNAYACAEDIALLMREVLKHQVYYSYAGIWMDELVHPSGRKTELTNTNRLIRYYKGCDAGKTGSTNEAGYCVCASAKKDNLRLISVVIGAKTGAERFSQAGTLFDYGFANYENKKLLNAWQDIELEAKVSGAKQKTFIPKVAEDCYALCKKNDKSAVELKYIIAEDIGAPVKIGDVIGKVLVVQNNEVINEVALVSPDDFENFGYKDSVDTIIDNWKI